MQSEIKTKKYFIEFFHKKKFFPDLYFFNDNAAYKFHTINMTAALPITTSQLWRFCPVAIKISSDGNIIRTSSLSTFIVIIVITIFSMDKL